MARRRPRQSVARPHVVGPLRLSDGELEAVKAAAALDGLSVGAYLSEAALAAAERGYLLPLTPREQLGEVIQARVALGRIHRELGEVVAALDSAQHADVLAEVEAVRPSITAAVRRVEAAGDVIAEALPRRR